MRAARPRGIWLRRDKSLSHGIFKERAGGLQKAGKEPSSPYWRARFVLIWMLFPQTPVLLSWVAWVWPYVDWKYIKVGGTPN